MIDPPGYREAMDAIESAPGKERKRMGAEQAHLDRMKAKFDHIVQTAEPDPGELRNTLLGNLTTKPKMNFGNLGLTWMQRLPEHWQGWYPEQCQKVAQMMNFGEAVQ